MSICDEPQRDYSSSDVSGEAFGMRKGVTTDLNIEALGRLLDSKLVDVKRDLHRIENKLSTTKQDIFNEINKEFNRVIDTLKVEFTQTTDLLSDQIKDLQVELSTVNKKMQNLEEENCRLSAELTAVKTNPTTIHNITKLEDIVDQMRLELNDRDQALLQNDVEITGVPEQPGESPLHITKAISLKLGMELEERDVISVDRVGQVRTTSSADGTRSRPRPLAVRLSRRTLRDDMLRNARVRRDLDTRDIGLAEHTPSRIFINERLTKINRQLFWKARQAANATGWKFVWTREGRIYAKQTDSFDSKRLRIHDEKEVERVFGTDRTSTNNK
ncbi:uncharacterized protein LOC125238961 [Leguminivora glycinivorella]|uniref:uncharacterized protein LOC125238961 n=1 Tax=Leguminivora glycinivorella TaxID=1035111 RepID=UPI00200D2627|nr:uncharacterized protein LOC125238961 [Leguminivora glycinivorella]